MSSDGKIEILPVSGVQVSKENPLLTSTSQRIRNLYLVSLHNKKDAGSPQRATERQHMWDSILADSGGVRFGDSIRHLKNALELAIPLRTSGSTTLFNEFSDPFVREFLTDLLSVKTHIENSKNGESTISFDEASQRAASQEFTSALLKKQSGNVSQDLFLKYFSIDNAIRYYLQDPSIFGSNSLQ